MKTAGCLLFVSLFFFGCSTIQNAALYEQPATPDNKPNVNGFYQVQIYHDAINNDVWFSKKPNCVQVYAVASNVKSGEGGLDITWNKQAEDCGWLGMGFGWDNWTGKDLSQISKTAAISIWAKTKKGTSKGLPWAVALEDYSGNQAWSGVTADCVVGGVIGENWTQVIIPLDRFDLDPEADIDATSIKQLMFQFESSGSIYLDEISIIPYASKGINQVAVDMIAAPKIDGVLSENEWPAKSFMLESGAVKVSSDANNIYIAGKIKNEFPFQNNQSGKDIWNGDAVEIAFSTNSKADAKRKIYYSTDKHIGIQLGGAFEIYNWNDQKKVEGTEMKKSISNDTLIFEASVPWSSLWLKPWEKGNVYGIEVAIDKSGKDGNREVQYRWNSKGQEGFNTNPALWGTIKIN